MPGIGRGPWLKSLRFDSASVLAQRDDPSSIKEEMALELAELRGEQKGGGGLAAFGSVRFWRYTSELERLRRRQRWLRSEITRCARAIERVSEAIELRARQAAG